MLYHQLLDNHRPQRMLFSMYHCHPWHLELKIEGDIELQLQCHLHCQRPGQIQFITLLFGLADHSHLLWHLVDVCNAPKLNIVLFLTDKRTWKANGVEEEGYIGEALTSVFSREDAFHTPSPRTRPHSQRLAESTSQIWGQ
jgi:hypothetical protein